MNIRFTPREKPKSKWDVVPYNNETWAEEHIDDWTVALRLMSQDGHAIVSEIRVFPFQPHPDRDPGTWDDMTPVPVGGLRSSTLTKVHLSTLLAEAQRLLSKLAAAIPEREKTAARMYEDPFLISGPLIDAGFDSPETSGTRHPSHKRPGSKGHSQEHYLFYAKEYADLVQNGTTTPHVEVAERFWPGEDRSKLVSDQVAGARERGLLTDPPVAGTAGGKLTQRAEKDIAALGRNPIPDHLKGG